MRNKRQEKKKKDREYKVQEKLKIRRKAALEIHRKEKAEKIRLDKIEEEFGGRPKMIPIKRPAKTPEEIQEQLEHNAQVLRALEEEYEREAGARRNLSADASEAMDRIKEKLDAMNIPVVNNAAIEKNISE